jgi:hypothetical protein
MNRRIVFVALLLITVWPAAPAVDAWYRGGMYRDASGGGYVRWGGDHNFYTGGYYHGGAAYNPYTGRYGYRYGYGY